MTSLTGATPTTLETDVKPVPYAVALLGAAAQLAALLGLWASKTTAGACLEAPRSCDDAWGRLVLAVLACASLLWVVSFVAGKRAAGHSDASYVDRLWSIQPAVYCWYLFAHAPSPRLLLMSALVSLWAARLTYNFYIKGGYSGGEDYRWVEVRRWYGSGLRYEVFHLVFVCFYQQCLILAFTTPAAVAAQHDAPLNALDASAAALFLALLALEAAADRQMFVFQTEKYRRIRAKSPPHRAYSRGFIETGAWAYSRHPNYFAEVFIWWSFFLFSIAAAGNVNWSLAGPALLTLLFVPPGASVDVTENLSSRKYAAYAEYRKRVPRFLPWPPLRPAAQRLLGPVARGLLLAFFLSHIPITLLVDAQAVVDRSRFPEFARGLLDWHCATNHDFLMRAPPTWFRSIVTAELALQLPFFAVAAAALWRGDEASFRPAFLVYGAHVATTMIPILGAIAASEGFPSEAARLRLALIYLPYLLFPLACIACFARPGKNVKGD